MITDHPPAPSTATSTDLQLPDRPATYTPPARRQVSDYLIMSGALTAFVAVAAGAFGAHMLRGVLPAYRLEIFETAARYQMYHALALLAAGWLASRCRSRAAPLAGWLFLVGIAVFSGSLYLFSLTGVRSFAAITPVGGAAFLAGWLAFAWAAWRR